MKVKLPDSPGVYFFVDKNKKVLYIGKATSLRNRVRSYFVADILDKRSPLVAEMVRKAKSIKFQKTDSVLEALILEANLIKKHKPLFNTALKDQKSWNFVVITKEDFPRVLVVRERELSTSPPKPPLLVKERGKEGGMIKYKFGPFVHGGELKEALKIIRKIFPYRDKCMPNQDRACFNRQIGLCPGVCTGEINEQKYAKTIRNIRMIFEGKKPALLKSLQKEMKTDAKNRDFEKASEIKKKVFALQHIQDIALLKNNKNIDVGHPKFKIEAYDVAHISGTSVVGVMTVIENGEVQKSNYRKFKISVEKNDDINALREVIGRRLEHSEWPYPDLMVVDGGDAQMNVTEAELEKKGLNIPIVAVVKDQRHKAREIRGVQFTDRKREILLANDEAHRFAVAYHRKKRDFIVR